MATVGLFPSLTGMPLVGSAVTGVFKHPSGAIGMPASDAFLTGPSPDTLLAVTVQGGGSSGGGDGPKSEDVRSAVRDLEKAMTMYEFFDACVQLGFVDDTLKMESPNDLRPFINKLFQKVLNEINTVDLKRLDQDPDVRKAALTVVSIIAERFIELGEETQYQDLAELTRQSAIGIFLYHLENDQDSSIRASAARNLGEFGDSSVEPYLKAARRDQDRDVRRSAKEALREIRRRGAS